MSVHSRFYPKYGSGLVLAATASSQNTTIKKGNKQMSLLAVGTDVVFVRVSDSADTTAATTTDYACAPGVPRMISINEDFTRFSYIATGTGSTLYAIQGDGF